MATIKSYTDLEQSKKLAEILPLESADMHWTKDFDGSWFPDLSEFKSVKIPKYVDKVEEHLLPCWSLASLLSVFPILDDRSPVTSKTFDKKYRVLYHSTAYEKAILTIDYDNPIDACVAMIEKLHELKML